jgi:hypothetical protein
MKKYERDKVNLEKYLLLGRGGYKYLTTLPAPFGWFLCTLRIGVTIVAKRKIPTFITDVYNWNYNTAHVGFIV